jgi:ubiquinone biosynthesis protein
MATDPRLEALRALADTGMRLARGTTSARLALAGLRDVVDPATLPPQAREKDHGRARGRARPGDRRPARQGGREGAAGRLGREALLAAGLLRAEPVARTPAAQVHRGVHDGADVAIKVLRPGIADSVRQDLNLLETLIRPLAAVFPSLAPGLLLREVRERILDELDLEHEASTQRSFARALRRHPACTSPRR